MADIFVVLQSANIFLSANVIYYKDVKNRLKRENPLLSK